MTPLEQEALEVAIRLRRALTTTASMTRPQIQDLMGDLRDLIKHLENKKFGCATGQHQDFCACGNGKNMETHRKR